MCVILVKPANAPMIKWEFIFNSMNNNGDGAGIMFPHDGKVQIHKGFMNYRQLRRFMRSLKSAVNLYDIPLVFHARLATHGKTKPENTHPFPLTNDKALVQAITATADIGIAHNGVISQMPRDDIFSDSQLLVMNYLSYLSWEDLSKGHIRALLEQLFGKYNRMALMNGNGELLMLGDFEWKADDGLFASNTSYRYAYRGRGTTYYGTHGWYDGDDFSGYDTNTGTHMTDVRGRRGSSSFSTTTNHTKDARNPKFWKTVFEKRDKIVAACFGGDNSSFYKYVSSFQKDSDNRGCEACKAAAKDIVFSYNYDGRRLCWECVTCAIIEDFEKLDLNNQEVKDIIDKQIGGA